ncbi:hypothetical protein R3W88_016423 [Solanum pinnatisectum]|uniref:Pentatricopeptide repeat-containing protein n=1 Tax=Solanum pinnatisectum TaxID=50273 RepID=A0AAV9L0F5_9SOLN|nr:hypothetical protein R3W88_016423 [Solanum pinnatisectum]
MKKEHGFSHNLFTYKCIVEKLRYYGEFKAMEYVIEEARKNIDNRLLEGVYITAIRGYGKKRKVQQAVDVFEKMDFFNCESSVHLFNTIMNLLVEHGYFKQANKVYIKMLENGIYPDGDVQESESERLLNKILKRGVFPNLITSNLLIQGLSVNGQQHEAARMLEALRKEGLNADIVTYNTLICGLYKHSKVVEAESYLHKMVNRGFEPDAFTYNTIIGFVPDVLTLCSLIYGLCQDGDFNRAKSLFNEATGKCMNEFWHSYKWVCENEDLNGAYELFKRMKRQYKYSHTTATYNILISAFVKKLKMDMADKLFLEMNECGCPPDNYTYRCMIDDFCKDDNTKFGYRFLLENFSKKFLSSNETVGRVINCLCVKNMLLDVVGIIHLMVQKGVVPDVKNYITYYAYEVSYDGIRDKKILKKFSMKFFHDACLASVLRLNFTSLCEFFLFRFLKSIVVFHGSLLYLVKLRKHTWDLQILSTVRRLNGGPSMEPVDHCINITFGDFSLSFLHT